MATSSSNIDLSGPTFCVLTGASQGIGREISVELSKCVGPNSVMVLLARNLSGLADTAALCESPKVKVVYKSIDLAKATASEMYDILKDALEGHDIDEFSNYIIFHNVGSIGDLSIESGCMENIEEMKQYYTLNVFNVIALNTQFLKLFKDVEDRIIIVNITSLCAIKPMSGMAYYCSGKAAREMYFRVLAEEKKHIKILNYSPGPVETSMIDYVIDQAVNTNLKDVFISFKSQGILLKPEETAKKCMRVLLSGKFSPAQHFDYYDEE
ncbi:Sepiapterin reductase [Eumeta japonica]|uniref:Sepiapterin reductase n=1 Tax=Eumeta variegata TaxID=151549 RepID=A0A4C1WHC2_EUMVA|nr:Sepiapterin reductase [Eumeta japonica]